MLAPVSTLASASLSPELARSASSPRQASVEDAQKAARQFEAILVRQLLSPAIEPLMNGSALGGSGGAGGQGGGVYGYLLTDTLSGSIAQGGGLGLANVIGRQLAPTVSAASSLADESA